MSDFRPFIDSIVRSNNALSVARLALKEIIKACEGQSDFREMRERAELSLKTIDRIMDAELP